MTSEEELLEKLLNGFEEAHTGTVVWAKDPEIHHKGYLMFEDADAATVFIVTVEEGKVVPT